MKQRIITAIVLIIVIVPLVVMGGIPFQILMGLIGAFASYELLSITSNPKASYYLYPLTTLYIVYPLIMDQNELVSSSFIVLYLIVLLICNIFDKKLDFSRLSYYFTGATLVLLGLHMVYYLRLELGLEYVLFLAFATLGADTGAYFVGRAFGKHKLNPRLSPKKTIEGSIGGTVIGGLLAFAYASLTHLPVDTLYLVIMALVLSTTGQVGDLSFSAIKRYFNVKDYSQIFPGHGGILDRFDSIIFNAMVLGLLLNFIPLG